MNFINSAVDVHALPAAENSHLHQVHPAYKKVLKIEWAITAAVLLLITTVLIITNSEPWWILLGATLIISSWHYLFIERSFPYLAYAVREKDVIHQKGWIIRRIKTCPFNRIQNCSVQSGPLERKYGLASLIIYTAGADGADMRISGLQHEEADKLRHFILSKIHNEPDEAA